MPIYEYQCESCRHQLEVLQKISEAPLIECPACGDSALKKLISAAAFRLKGSGWYETDFKTGDKKNLATGSDGDKASGGADSTDKPSAGTEKKTSSTDKSSTAGKASSSSS